MSGIEVFGIVAGTLGLAEVIKLVVEKIFSKKSDKIANVREEFAVMKDRVKFNEEEINRLSQNEIENKRHISRLYTVISDITLLTCSKEKCPMRDIVAIDFDSIKEGIENASNCSRIVRQEQKEENEQ